MLNGTYQKAENSPPILRIDLISDQNKMQFLYGHDCHSIKGKGVNLKAQNEMPGIWDENSSFYIDNGKSLDGTEILSDVW